MSPAVKAELAVAYEAKFTFLFENLAVGGTAEGVRRYVKGPAIERPAPGVGPAVEAAPDDPDAGE